MIIGITGKVGSGKSFISEYIANQTGMQLVKFDYQMAEVLNTPVLKGILEKRVKNKIPKAYTGIQLFPLLKNLEKPFTKFEIAVVAHLLNKKMKKLINKAKCSMIVDFTALPLIEATNKMNMVLMIESDDKLRIERLAKRDGMTIADTARVDEFVTKCYNFDNFKYDKKLHNDYETVSTEILELVNQFKKA